MGVFITALIVWKFLRLWLKLINIRFDLFWSAIVAGELMVYNIYLSKLPSISRRDILHIWKLSEQLFPLLILTSLKCHSDLHLIEKKMSVNAS